MALLGDYKTLEKLRSYSSVFSSISFQKLLQYDDYSFLNVRIERFDKPKIGKSINTYHDYIQFIYKELIKQYRSEYVYKNTFINNLLLDKYGVKNTIAINEFRVGNSIADIVMFNGTSKAFEIKTELDSNRRLGGQLADYTKIFKKCYIITHESLVDKYLQEDKNIGIIELIERPRSLVMREVRDANENKYIDADTLIRSIRTSEYKNIVKQYYGELPEMDSFNMFDICKELIRQIPSEKLNHLFIEELKKRKSNTEVIHAFHNELRQLCLAMNINVDLYQELNSKLCKTINLS
ncbi:MAG: sce7726 family protein [Candidatus Izemoplasmatales bacterium]|nr:sce7726 family protein [Candidatus Izemoplasmatales bacterium]